MGVLFSLIVVILFIGLCAVGGWLIYTAIFDASTFLGRKAFKNNYNNSDSNYVDKSVNTYHNTYNENYDQRQVHIHQDDKNAIE